MSRQLSDLYDVQGLVRGYGAKKYPVGRFLFVRFDDPQRGRNLIGNLQKGISTAGALNDDDDPSSMDPPHIEEEECDLAVADALDWPDGPPIHRLNIAFTHAGLKALELPWEVLDSFPKEFKIGMKYRTVVNGDTGPSAPDEWDEVWQDRNVHAWLGLYARDETCLAAAANAIQSEIATSGCTIINEQPVNHLKDPDAKHDYSVEHFGFADGLSNPPVDGVARDGNYAGGCLDETGQWQAMAAGEFVLGPYQDEIAERPKAPASDPLATNGSFMVYRKLEQDVDGFRQYIEDEATRLQIDPDLLAAKMVGRKRDGTPLAKYGRRHSQRSVGQGSDPPPNDFLYESDPRGDKCPLGSHVRRANPRDTFGFGTELVNRHRMLRRGIPYGTFVPNGDTANGEDDDDGRGLIFIALNASIERQFEFVQQQWINYGDSLFQGSDKDPVVGNSPESDDVDGSPRSYGQFRFWNEEKGQLNICSAIPRFVTTKGGDYFFLPGIRALNYLAMGRYVRDGDGEATG